MTNNSSRQSYRSRYRPYLYAMAAAFVTTMLVAPEVVDGDSMAPALTHGQVIVMTKEDYSEKRDIPDLNEIVVLGKNYTKEFRDQSNIKNDNAILRVAALPGKTISSADLLGDYPGPVKLSENQVWLICDHLPENMKAEELTGPYLDSRTMGPVDMKQIRGKARWIVWPLSDIGGIM